jgi:diguanylate cyclase (GGDEF)-like protein/PAS domain S-box-containing protein
MLRPRDQPRPIVAQTLIQTRSTHCRRTEAGGGAQPCRWPGQARGLLPVLWSACVALLSAGAHAEDAIERSYFFAPATREGDLAQNTVTALMQDRTGFLWVATQGGLHRYDGYEYLRFQHRNGDADSLPENHVTAIAEDSAGRLFAGTAEHGVARWDAAARRFLRVPSKLEHQPRRDAVTALLADRDGGLWIGSRFGLEHLDAAGRRSDVLRMPGEDQDARVNDLAHCADGALYASTGAGLFRVNPGSLRARALSIPEVGTALRALHCDATGALWATAGARLYEWQNGEMRLAWDGAAAVPALAHVQFVDLREDAAHALWLASNGGGLVRFVPSDGSFTHLRQHPRLRGSLPEDTLNTLLVDRSGLLWVGSSVSGLSYTEPGGAPFTYLRDDTAHSPIETNNIRALWPDADRGLWIGTEGDGLKRYDFSTRRFQRHTAALVKALGSSAPPPDLRIAAIRPAARPGSYWIGSNRGVFLFDAEAGTAAALPIDARRDDALPSADIRTLIVGSDGDVWMGTRNAGLVRYHPGRNQWQRYPAPTGAGGEGLWHASVHALFEDAERRLWIGTLGGLNVLEIDSGVLHRVAKDPALPDALAGEMVRTITQTANGDIWVGTHNGLNRLLDYRDGQPRFRVYTVDHGLANDTIYGLLEDRLGRLWISTNAGISRLDPQSGTVRNFGLQDGLQAVEFNGGAYAQLPDGRLAFAGPLGINWFRPERIDDGKPAAPLAFTAYQVGNERRDVADPYTFAALSIGSDDRVLMLAFAALDFSAGGRSRYAYRLLGYDDDWIELGTRREVAFTNLEPGDYRLQITGGVDGRARGTPLELAVAVIPHWWQTWWAQGAAVLLASGLLFAWWLARRRRARALRQQTEKMKLFSERLSSALWASRDGFWDWNLETDVMFLSGPEEFVGPGREARISSAQWRQLAVHPDDRLRVEAALEEHISGRSEYYEAEYRVATFSGRRAMILARGRAIRRDPQGRALQVAGTFRDVSQERMLDRDRRIAQEVIRSMREVVCVTDLNFRFVSVNEAFCRVTGYTMDEVAGQDAAMLNSDQHSPEYYLQIRDTLLQKGHWGGELWQRRKDGEQFLASLETNEVCDSSGQRQYWVAVLTDITDRKRAEQELRYLANYDTLTGLPNRTLLGERLAHSLIRARRLGSKVGVLFLDLDRFKHVNDSMGHAAGDRLLKAAAARIVTSVRETDTVARLGGDEFTVVLEDLKGIHEAEVIARKLLSGFERPLEIDGRNEVVISPSIGLSLYPEHGQVPTDLLKHADTAMYHAKDRGRNTYQVYTDAMDAQARLRASMAGQLHKALERNELSLVFQPKLSLVDRRFTGAEALLRWNNPILGQVSPVTFIPIAEETGLIVPIGEWVLEQACQQINRWNQAGLTEPKIAVNVSALQLFRGELAGRLREILEGARVPAHRIEIELTESMLMANPEQSIATLTRIKALGVHIAIDDFGTGYSSLAYLKRLPIDTLKIDKTFVADLSSDPDDEAITTTVIMMAHSLGLDVIAEGVETPEQMRYLAEQRCDEVQGNLISHPLDADRVLQFLLERRTNTQMQAALPLG